MLIRIIFNVKTWRNLECVKSRRRIHEQWCRLELLCVSLLFNKRKRILSKKWGQKWIWWPICFNYKPQNKVCWEFCLSQKKSLIYNTIKKSFNPFSEFLFYVILSLFIRGCNFTFCFLSLNKDLKLSKEIAFSIVCC